MREQGAELWAWLARGCGSYAEMTDLPAPLRALLEEHVPLSTLTLEREQSARDGTVKALLATSQGRPVEAVHVLPRSTCRPGRAWATTPIPPSCAATIVRKVPKNLEE